MTINGVVFLDCSATEGEENRLGTIDEYNGKLYIEDQDYGLAMSLPAGVIFPIGTVVLYTIPNPTPGVFVEDYHDQVSHVEEVTVVPVK